MVFILSHPAAYQPTSKNVDSAISNVPDLLWHTNGISKVVRPKWVLRPKEYHKKEAKIILCIFVTIQNSEAHIFYFFFFFMISRNSTGFISLCPDFYDMSLGRPAHGLQTLLDVGALCHFQQSAGKPYNLVNDGTHVC